MFREWTERTFAHPFKRLAQLAVVGLALAGLAACGGSSISDAVEAIITPDSPSPYGSMAFATSTSWGNAAWRSADSRTAARDAAVAACGSECREVLWFQNACGSLATSTDNTRAGVGWGRTRSASGESAIAQCRAAGGQGCRVSTSSAGTPSTFCAQGGTATPTGQASTIPPRPAPGTQPSPSPSPSPSRYVSFGRTIDGTGLSWEGGSGSTAAAAQSDALATCRIRARGRTCQAVRGYTGCLALAYSACTSNCRRPASAVEGAPTKADARTKAVASCESVAGTDRGTCRIGQGDTGGEAVICGSAGR